MLKKLFSVKSFRGMTVLFLCASAVGGLGCATFAAFMYTTSGGHRQKVPPKLLFKDTVFALAKTSPELRKALGGRGDVAFLGYKYTYLLSNGGERLLSIAQELDGSRLQVECRPAALIMKSEHEFEGHLTVKFKPLEKTPNYDQERNILERLGFKPSPDGFFALDVGVDGSLLEPVKLTADLTSKLKKKREISFYSPATSEWRPRVDRVAAGIVLVPVGVAVDVALIPVYGLVLLTLGASGNL